MRILLAEADLCLGNLIKHMLERENHQVAWVQHGDEVFNLACYTTFDVIVLDWMMQDVIGSQICECLDKNGYQGSLLILPTCNAMDDQALGWDTAVDVYSTKSIELAVLTAQLRTIARRGFATLQEEIIQTEALSLNQTSSTVQRGKKEVQLTSREFQILDMLVQNSGRVVPRKVIIDRIWGKDTKAASNNLDAYIRLLRKKLDLPEAKSLITNVRGIGYKMEIQNA